MELTKSPVAVVTDAYEGRISKYNRLGYPQDLGYFNSGVMLINLDRWRNAKILNRCMDFIKCESHRIKIVDQDVLNYVLRNDKTIIPLKYNLQTGFTSKRQFLAIDYKKYGDQIEEALSDPVIVHYTGRKPWEPGCQNPYRSLYKLYQDMAGLDGQLLISRRKYIKMKLETILKKNAKRILSIVGHNKYRCIYRDFILTSKITQG